MTEQVELILRVEAKKKEFQAELVGIKNNITESAKESKINLEKKIQEMTDDLKSAREYFSEAIAKKINKWLR